MTDKEINKFNQHNEEIYKKLLYINKDNLYLVENLCKYDFFYEYKKNNYILDANVSFMSMSDLQLTLDDSIYVLQDLEDIYNYNFINFQDLEEIIRKDSYFETSMVDSLLYASVVEEYHITCSVSELVIEIMDIARVYHNTINKIIDVRNRCK